MLSRIVFGLIVSYIVSLTVFGLFLVLVDRSTQELPFTNLKTNGKVSVKFVQEMIEFSPVSFQIEIDRPTMKTLSEHLFSNGWNLALSEPYDELCDKMGAKNGNTVELCQDLETGAGIISFQNRSVK